MQIKPLLRSIESLLLACTPALLLRLRPRSARLRGQAGERVAEQHLQKTGHQILARNLAHPAAELDIVSQTSTHLVVTEVKTSLSEHRPLRVRFGPYAMLRQRIAARALGRRLHKRPRIDLIEVHLPPGSQRIRVKHWQGL